MSESDDPGPTTASTSLPEQIYDAVEESTPLPDARVDRLDVGEDLLLLRIAAGDGERAAGVSHRPPGSVPADPEGQLALDVGEWALGPPGDDPPTGRAVGLAALNALSAPIMDWRTGDPMEALAEDVDVIATVGLFGPAFRKFGAVEVRVIERRDVEPPARPPDVTVSLFDPSEAEAAMAGADVAFVTGSSLLYGGAEAYLEAARDVPSVVLIGSTASFVPGPAFDAGATMLAGARVDDVAAVRRGILAGECATDLHDVGLRKVYVAAAEHPGLELG